MINPVITQLIRKDIDLNKKFIGPVTVAGLFSIALTAFSDVGYFVGSLLFITTLVAFGIMLVMYGLAQEREKQIHLFVLSLPVTARDYYVSKVVSTVLCFLAPWFVCAVAVVLSILTLDSVPDGSLAYAVVMLLYFVCNFCLFLGIVLSTLSEKVMIAAIIGTNICITLSLQLFTRVPALGDALEVDHIVWSPVVSMIVLCELLFCVLCLWTALYLRERNKDLV